MEGFVGKFGKHEAAGWVWSQLQAAYAKAGNHDKVLEAGKVLLSMDAADMEAAYANLKAAEAKKDSDGVLSWAVVAPTTRGKRPRRRRRTIRKTKNTSTLSILRSRWKRTWICTLPAAAVTEQDPCRKR